MKEAQEGHGKSAILSMRFLCFYRKFIGFLALSDVLLQKLLFRRKKLEIHYMAVRF